MLILANFAETIPAPIMPPSPDHFRALLDDFRLFVERRGAWPPLKAFKAKFHADEVGYDKAEVAGMKRGAAVPEKYVATLIALLHGKPAISDFLEGRGVQSHLNLTTDEIMSYVTGPLLPHAVKARGAIDWHMAGLDGLVGLFTDFVWRTLIRPRTLCENEADVRSAVSMILLNVGREVGGSETLSPEQAIKIAETHMKIGEHEYYERALDIWKRSKWTLAFAVVDRQRVGCSFILPLKEPVYEELRRGDRSTHTCMGDDVEFPSTTFFLEAVSHKPDSEYEHVDKKTSQSVRTIFLQLAALSLADGRDPFHEKRPLRILSIAGNRKNEKRLKRSGFHHIGTKMPGFDIEFMEMDERKAWFIPLVVKKLQERLIQTGYTSSKESSS